MGIAQKVSRLFSDAVRSRGQSYFAKGRVAVTAASPGEVVAKVRGTAKYRVRLRVRGTKLHVSCTCPYFAPTGEPCKHLWATILLADARGLLQAPPVRPLKMVSDLPPKRRAGAADVPAGPDGGRPPAQGAADGRPKRSRKGRRDRSGTAPWKEAAGRAPRQGGQPQLEAAAGLRARRAVHADPEPGRHRPRPPAAAADRRVGPAEALVALAGDPRGEVRPRGPRPARPARRRPVAHPAGQRGQRARPVGRRQRRHGHPPVRPPPRPGRRRRAARPHRPAPAPPDRGGGRPADDALGRRPPLAVLPRRPPRASASAGPGAARSAGSRAAATAWTWPSRSSSSPAS